MHASYKPHLKDAWNHVFLHIYLLSAPAARDLRIRQCWHSLECIEQLPAVQSIPHPWHAVQDVTNERGRQVRQADLERDETAVAAASVTAAPGPYGGVDSKEHRWSRLSALLGGGVEDEDM